MVQELEPEEEYLLPRPEAKARRAAREKFLQTIRDKAPAVLRSLADDVLPFYQAAFDQEENSDRESGGYFKSLLSGLAIKDPNSAYTIVYPVSPDVYGEREREVTKFQHAIRQWAEQWHLIDYWCLDVAERTLQTWLRLDSTNNLDWQYPAEFAGGSIIYDKVRFECMSWDTEAETWDEYKKMFLDEAKKWLEVIPKPTFRPLFHRVFEVLG